MSDEERYDANVDIQAQAANLRAVHQRAEHAEAQIYRLAQYLLDHYPEEIKGPDDEGAVTLAIRILDKLQAAQAEAAALRSERERIAHLIESLDVQLERIPGDDGFVAGYRMNTGIWHRLLAIAREVPSGDAGAAYQRRYAAMHAALQWYADPENYVDGCAGDGSDYPNAGGFVYDNGQRARDALSAPAAERAGVEIPDSDAGLTVEGVRLYCERMADQARDALDNAGTEWSRDLVGCFNVGWQEGFESAYRALAEALSRGELPGEETANGRGSGMSREYDEIRRWRAKVEAAVLRAEKAEQQVQAAQAEAAALRSERERIAHLIESLDVQLERIPGDDGFIAGYRMNTGIWHRLLALARGVPSGDAAFLAEHQAMRAALEQLAEHARIAGDANPHCPAFRVIARRARAALSGDAGAAFQREHEAMRTLVSEIRDMAATLSCHHSQPGDEFTYDCCDWGDIVRRIDALSAPTAEPEVQP